MKIDKKILAARILKAPDARLEESEEKRRAKQLLLLLAGDRRTEERLSLADISAFFADVNPLLREMQGWTDNGFDESKLKDCETARRRAV